MKKGLSSCIGALLIIVSVSAQEQKTVSDCTVIYKVSVQGAKPDAEIVKAMSTTEKTIYIKGVKSRNEVHTPNFSQAIIYDSRTDSSIVLRELGNTKYISFLDGESRRQKNQKYEGMKLNQTNEKKTVLGYECTKVVARLADGSSYDIYYTPSIVPSATGYEYQFKDLPGLVLEYEAALEKGNTKVTFTASNINFTPVPVAKFDVPKTGYRVL
jgi:GLPGLI family protein